MGPMLVYDFVLLDMPCERAANWFRSASIAAALRASTDVLGCDDGTLQCGEVRASQDGLVLDLRWHGDEVSDADALRPLEGELRLAPLSAVSSHLSLRGHFAFPDGSAPVATRLHAQRTADQRAREFLGQIGFELTSASVE